MVNAGILDGDLVLVEQQATCGKSEKKIVALVNDSATVKNITTRKTVISPAAKTMRWIRSCE